ncbi:hypothetical protein CXG81DRAFT_9841 [Caulochytrium protostelioides]|uniref:cytochrome-b5 reductase n=1 Tax=Caulochytrium protostelioides TaxID=1555241 RepID=A0A4P9XCN4_9FUNG|nr:hypothetical protein CXG81DRAFT_9841 [Caulochytrium protostelioides]|eukprot:RKP03193.1 hypothetical protein CXG81DRAFT_9841 [Caulochytrium protostelioides]
MSASKPAARVVAPPRPENPVPALNGKDWQEFTLKRIVDVNYNTKIFRFRLPAGATELGLPTASCVLVRFQDGVDAKGKKKFVVRPYTPLEDPSLGVTGEFDLLIKHYEGGPMSTHIFNMVPGDKLQIKGPIAKYQWKKNETKEIALIAGGTGITPMLQIIQRILSDPEDMTRMSLTFCNVTERDILMRPYLDSLQTNHPNQFRVQYLLEKPTAGWNGPSGLIRPEILNRACPTPGNGKVFVCGPDGFVKAICGNKNPDLSQGTVSGYLKDMGYTENDVYKF